MQQSWGIKPRHRGWIPTGYSASSAHGVRTDNVPTRFCVARMQLGDDELVKQRHANFRDDQLRELERLVRHHRCLLSRIAKMAPG